MHGFANNINRTARPVSIVISWLYKLHTLYIFLNFVIVSHLTHLCFGFSAIISFLLIKQRLNIQIATLYLQLSANIDTHIRRLCVLLVPNKRRILFGVIFLARYLVAFQQRVARTLISQLTFLIKNSCTGTHASLDIQRKVFFGRFLRKVISCIFRFRICNYLLIVKINKCLFFLLKLSLRDFILCLSIFAST